MTIHNDPNANVNNDDENKNENDNENENNINNDDDIDNNDLNFNDFFHLPDHIVLAFERVGINRVRDVYDNALNNGGNLAEDIVAIIDQILYHNNQHNEG